MRIQNTPLSIEDFRKSNWQEVIELSEKKECHYYSSAFFEKAREHEEKNDTFTIYPSIEVKPIRHEETIKTAYEKSRQDY